MYAPQNCGEILYNSKNLFSCLATVSMLKLVGDIMDYRNLVAEKQWFLDSLVVLFFDVHAHCDTSVIKAEVSTVIIPADQKQMGFYLSLFQCKTIAVVFTNHSLAIELFSHKFYPGAFKGTDCTIRSDSALDLH